MKKIIFLLLCFSLLLTFGYAKDTTTKVILLISEQNIEGPQRCWWASEIDLSATEAKVASQLLAAGYQVLEPSNLTKVIRQDPAFRLLNYSEGKAVKLGNLSRANYVVVGKAVASAGGNVPQSSMRSCFANITAKLIRVKDGKVVAYLDAAGSSAHMDVITGGREALVNAAYELADKIIGALNQEKADGKT
jgi:opacity protein-like surface antigen